MGHKKKQPIYFIIEDVYMVHNNMISVFITKVLLARLVDIKLSAWLLSEGKSTKEGWFNIFDVIQTLPPPVTREALVQKFKKDMKE